MEVLERHFLIGAGRCERGGQKYENYKKLKQTYYMA